MDETEGGHRAGDRSFKGRTSIEEEPAQGGGRRQVQRHFECGGDELHEVAETYRGNFFVSVSVLGLFLPMAVSTPKNVISPSWNGIKSRFFRGDYLVSHPIQYQAPLLRYLSQQPEIDLTVFFLSDFSIHGFRDPGFKIEVRWDIPLVEGYKHVFLPSLGRRDRLSFWKPFSYNLRRHLINGKFDVLWLHGYAHQANLRALLMANWLGIKIFWFLAISSG